MNTWQVSGYLGMPDPRLDDPEIPLGIIYGHDIDLRSKGAPENMHHGIGPKCQEHEGAWLDLLVATNVLGRKVLGADSPW